MPSVALVTYNEIAGLTMQGEQAFMRNTMLQKFILLLGMVVMLALYFWGQNNAAQQAILINGFLALAGVVVDLAAVGALIAVSGAIGRRIGQIAQVDFRVLHQAERVALEAGLGLGLLSIFALVFGLVGLFNIVMWIVLLGVAVLLRRDVFAWLRDIRAVLAGGLRPQTGWEHIVVLFTAVMLFSALLLALSPPFAWDAMTYHLVGPHRYLQADSIMADADNHFLGFPQGVELLYGLLMALTGRATTAAPLHFIFGLLAMLATGGLVRRFTNRNTAYTSVLLFLTSYSLWRLFTIPYVDLGVMFYAAISLAAIIQWRDQANFRWLFLAGIHAGFALGVKYTAGGLIFALVVSIALAYPRRMLRHVLIFGSAALATFIPWLVKGLLLYQNPIYPYVFDGLAWDSLRTANFSATGGGLLAGDLAWQWFILPVSATIFGQEQRSPYSFTLGAWLLTMPFALLLGRRFLPQPARLLARAVLPLALVSLIFWMALAAVSGIGAQPRLMLFGLPFAVVLGALAFHGVAHWPRTPLDINFLMRAALALTVLLGFFTIADDLAKADPDRYLIENDGERYLRANLGSYYAAVRQLESLPPGSQVLLMWEPKSFYCPDHIICLPDILFDHWSWPLRRGVEGAALMQQWRDDGIDYLLVHGLREGSDFGYDFWLSAHDTLRAENAQFPAALADSMQPVWSDDFAYTLYTWRDES